MANFWRLIRLWNSLTRVLCWAWTLFLKKSVCASQVPSQRYNVGQCSLTAAAAYVPQRPINGSMNIKISLVWILCLCGPPFLPPPPLVHVLIDVELEPLQVRWVQEDQRGRHGGLKQNGFFLKKNSGGDLTNAQIILRNKKPDFNHPFSGK